MIRRQLILSAALALVVLFVTACGASQVPSEGQPASEPAAGGAAVRLDRLSATFDEPLYITSPPGDTSRLFVVEKGGRVLIVKGGAPLDEPFLDLRDQVATGAEQGLLSLAFHPAFARNRRLYVNYTDTTGSTRIAGFAASPRNPDRVDLSSRTEVLSVPQPYANHNGGQLQFGPDGLLYVGMGDGGAAGDPQGHAQDPESLLGKILRIDVDASPVLVQVFALGLRNPWRFSFDRESGALWIGDVGQNDREEVDYIPPGQTAGENLGWDAYEGSVANDAEAAARLARDKLVWPVAEYDRSAGSSVTGGYVYRGAAVPALKGLYVYGDYGSGRIWTLDGPTGTPVPLAGADGQLSRIASFGEDANAELYVVSLAGSIHKIVSAP